MFTERQIQELNKSFEEAAPSTIIQKAFELNSEAVVTTNFRPYEAAILHAVSKVEANISVV